jgi:hypothetical protein
VPKLAELYRHAADLPQRIPLFPLRGVVLLPRATLPLNVFEPRYLEMVDEAMTSSRVIGMVQPEGNAEEESPVGRTVPLRRIGCAGRVTGYQELDDGRLLITLSGIARFRLREELPLERPFRVAAVAYDDYVGDLRTGAGAEDVDREAFLKALRTYLEARNLKADWSAVAKSSTETLVNSLAVVSPYGAEEKQALLEAATLKARAEMLVALAEMELAAAGLGGSGSTLQ